MGNHCPGPRGAGELQGGDWRGGRGGRQGGRRPAAESCPISQAVDMFTRFSLWFKIGFEEVWKLCKDSIRWRAFSNPTRLPRESIHDRRGNATRDLDDIGFVKTCLNCIAKPAVQQGESVLFSSPMQVP